MDNNNRWSNLPNNVLADGQPASGICLPDNQIQCQRCTRTFEDNRNDDERLSGRKPCCQFCWIALELSGGEDRANRRPAPVEPSSHPMEFPNFLVGFEFSYQRRPCLRDDTIKIACELPVEVDHALVIVGSRR